MAHFAPPASQAVLNGPPEGARRLTCPIWNTCGPRASAGGRCASAPLGGSSETASESKAAKELPRGTKRAREAALPVLTEGYASTGSVASRRANRLDKLARRTARKERRQRVVVRPRFLGSFAEDRAGRRAQSRSVPMGFPMFRERRSRGAHYHGSKHRRGNEPANNAPSHPATTPSLTAPCPEANSFARYLASCKGAVTPRGGQPGSRPGEGTNTTSGYSAHKASAIQVGRALRASRRWLTGSPGSRSAAHTGCSFDGRRWGHWGQEWGPLPPSARRGPVLPAAG